MATGFQTILNVEVKHRKSIIVIKLHVCCTLITHTFSILQMRCSACGHQNIRFDPYNMLTLPLPAETNVCISLCSFRGDVYVVPNDRSPL